MDILKIILEPHKRLDMQLYEYLNKEYSRSSIQKYIKDKHVLIDDEYITKVSYTSPITKSMLFIKPKAKSTYIIPNNQNIPILYQDEYLAIIHKPEKMTVHPGANTKEDTLVHSLTAQLSTLSLKDIERPGIVHRLDRDTEGLMIIAKNIKIHEKLAQLFYKRMVYKEYHAWIYEQRSFQEEKIEGYISRDLIHRQKMKFTKEPLNIKSKFSSLTCTTLKIIKDFSLIKIILHTGRTHQIRACMYALNCPVIGDSIYFFKRKFNMENKFNLLLVANKIKFQHPETQKTLTFSIPLPQRFIDFTNKLSHA